MCHDGLLSLRASSKRHKQLETLDIGSIWSTFLFCFAGAGGDARNKPTQNCSFVWNRKMSLTKIRRKKNVRTLFVSLTTCPPVFSEAAKSESLKSREFFDIQHSYTVATNLLSQLTHAAFMTSGVFTQKKYFPFGLLRCIALKTQKKGGTFQIWFNKQIVSLLDWIFCKHWYNLGTMSFPYRWFTVLNSGRSDSLILILLFLFSVQCFATWNDWNWL